MAAQSSPSQMKSSKIRPKAGKEVQQSAEITAPQFAWVAEDEILINKVTSSQSPLNLHFVSETGTSRPGGTYRSLIRSQAKRSRLIPAATYDDTKLGTKGKLAQLQKPQPKSRKQLKAPGAFSIRGPGTGSRDPFDTLPIVANDHIQALLNHWDRVFRYSYAPPTPREKWLPFALSDAAFLNTTLFVSALNICGLKGIPLSPDVFYFKGETIRIINERLGNSKEKATDGMIGAVASLAHLENLAGSREGAKMHMDGLEAMVKSRGGLQALGSYGIPRRQAAWSDTCAAIFLETKPRFELVVSDNDDDNPADWSPYSPLALRYKTKLFNLTGLYVLSEEIIEVYWGLRNLSTLKDEMSCLLVPTVDILPYSDILERLERRLIAIIQAKMFVTPVQDLVIYALFSNAAILHIYMFLRDLSRGLPFFHLLSFRIRTMLEKVDIRKLKTQYPEMLLWILMMGGLCGIENSERGWFAGLMADFCLELGVHGGNEVAAMLSEFFWSELYRSPMTMGFWKDVAKAQGLEGGFGVRRLSDHVSVAIFNAPPDTAE